MNKNDEILDFLEIEMRVNSRYRLKIYACFLPFSRDSRTILREWEHCTSGVSTGLQIFFQDWWAEVTHGAKIGGSFS